jgi:hypothetical protein
MVPRPTTFTNRWKESRTLGPKLKAPEQCEDASDREHHK